MVDEGKMVEEWVQRSGERLQALMVRRLSLAGWTYERADAVLRRAAADEPQKARA